MAIVLSVGGAGCGGCIDEDTKARQGEAQKPDPSRVKRQRAVGTVLSVVDAGEPAAAGDP